MGIREELKLQLDTSAHKWPHNHFTEAFVFKQGGKEDTSNLGISGMGISLKALVADCTTLEILTRVYTSKLIFVWSSVSQPCQPCLNLRITWGAWEASVIPVPSCTTYPLLLWGGAKVLVKIVHEGRFDH